MLRHHSQRVSNLFLIAIFAVLLSAALGLWSCSRSDNPEKVEPVTIGPGPSELDALLYVADDHKFFAGNGLNVQLKKYASGLAGTDAMLKGEVDLNTATEFVIVGKAMKKQRILNIGTIATFQNEYLVGRTDKGIHTLADLKGKKIGLTRQTGPEFNLGRLLDLHGMNIEQVTIVDLPPEKVVDALVNGDVDGIIAWEPNVGIARERLGDVAVMWPSQSGQPKYWNLIGTDAWITKHRELVRRLLTSLVQAEDYLVRHPNDAKAIVQRRLNYVDSYMARIWPQHRFALSLDQGLIIAMKDEAQWMMRNNYTTESAIPDFTNYIYADGLKAIKPEVVNLIR